MVPDFISQAPRPYILPSLMTGEKGGVSHMSRGPAGTTSSLDAIRAAGFRPAARIHFQSVIEEESTGVGALSTEAQWNDRARSDHHFKSITHPINFNPGIIEGGDWASSVPAWCDVDCRIAILP